MAITRSQQAKQLLAQGGRTGFFSAGLAQGDEISPGTASKQPTSGGPARRDDAPDLSFMKDDIKKFQKKEKQRKKIKEEIAKGPTLRKRIKRNPLVQTASFFSNPLGFIGRKILDERKAKQVNELFGVDDDLGYTGADMGFVVSEPPKLEIPKGGGDNGGDDRPQQIISPTEMIAETPYQEDLIGDESLSAIQQALLERGKARAFAKEGGIMDLETGRQMYFLGKLVKKATRAIKKIGKSPIGKAALAFGAYKLGKIPFGESGTSLFDRGFELYDSMDRADKLKLGIGAALTAAPLFLQDDDNDEEYQQFLAQRNVGGQLPASIPDIRKNYRDYMARAFVADGGRIEYDEAGAVMSKEDMEKLAKSPLYKGFKTMYGVSPDMAKGNKSYKDKFEQFEQLFKKGYQKGGDVEPVAKKTMPLLDMGGMEKDYRADGGFVPIGRMERADDVPARLSKNEFVFTADAVRNAGEGDIDKGAEVMYNMMKNLEAGGEVSEESQGLNGARKMFQTSQRLEEVL